MAEDVGKAIMAGATPLEFTAPLFNKRRVVRAMRNPMDKCTIVSIFPKSIYEVKHTVEPGRFTIGAGSYEKPAILVIGSSSWWKDYDPDQPMLEIVHSSIQMADSIIKDSCNGLLGCNMSDSMPGLFFVLGEKTVDEIKLGYRKSMEEAAAKQKNWYTILVRLADALWARTQGNPLAIMDEMRIAANELNLKEKPYLKDAQISQLVPCKFCGGLRNPNFPICPQCKAIDQDHPLAKEIKFAV